MRVNKSAAGTIVYLIHDLKFSFNFPPPKPIAAHMKKLCLYFLLVSGPLASFCQFGIFASAIQLTTDGGTNKTFYNTNKLLGDPNAIGPINFGGSLGSFAKNDGKLRVTGGELKSFRTSNDNVCGGNVNYRVYPTGSTPGQLPFTQIGLGFFANCNNGMFADGKGPCSATDQKWQNVAASNDLTNMEPGDYTLEVYYDLSGKNGNTTACDETAYDSDNSRNYFMTFTITAALPVKLLEFTAVASKSGIVLTWATASEEHFNLFEIERSQDGHLFSTIGQLVGKGNSVVRSRYQFTDARANAGINYYRLKQIDMDGSFSYSPIVKTNIGNRTGIMLSPNPAASFMLIEGLTPGAEILISDISGRKILTTRSAATQLKVPVAQLQPGKYIVVITEAGIATAHSFVKE
jgi:hypothetical protein